MATPLLGYIPVDLLGRLIIIFIFLLIYGATIFLDRQLNGKNWGLSIFAGIFLYNGAFHLGFINYVIGIGFAMLGFGLWVRYRQMTLGFVLLAFIPVGMIVFLTHLYAWGIYAVCVCGYEVSIVWEEWNKEYPSRVSRFKIPAQAALTLVVSTLVYLFSSLSGSEGGTQWSTVSEKLEGLASPIFYSQHLVEIPLLLAIFVVFVWACATRTFTVNPRMVIPLGAFAVIYFIMPFMLLGSGFAMEFTF